MSESSQKAYINVQKTNRDANSIDSETGESVNMFLGKPSRPVLVEARISGVRVCLDERADAEKAG